MTFDAVLFWIFSTVLLASAVRVISARNPVHSALSLVLCFFSGGALWLLLTAEFLAIALILIYVGAVMVLFLFVIMMLDINIEELRQGFVRYLRIGMVVGTVVVAETLLLLSRSTISHTPRPAMPTAEYSNTKELGRLLYTEHLLHFEAAGAILLVAIIAAIALNIRQKGQVRRQKPSEQVRVRRKERLRIVKMPSENKP